MPPHWLDFRRLVTFWEDVFGAGRVHLRPYTPDLFDSAEITEEIRAAFGIEETIGRADPADPMVEPSEAWLARGRALNELPASPPRVRRSWL